jgi:O-glycosyl hydrolase
MCLMRTLIILIITIFLHTGCYTPARPDYSLVIDPEVTFQEIDGFGASDAWRCQFVGKNWPVEKREQIADWLFSTELDDAGNPLGIGLSIWRFYLAAGTTEQGEASGIANPWRRGECFLSADGTWDWTKHVGQRWFLQAALERGVPHYLAFTIAPPVFYSANGKGFASSGNTSFNIQKAKVRDYAIYLAEVLLHFRDSFQVEFDYISPFNEPQWNWDQGNQEGTPATNHELAEFMRHLSYEIQQRGLQTLIVPGEAATIDHLSGFVEHDNRDNQAEVFFSKSSPLYIGELPNMAPIISAHSYFTVWPTDEQVAKRKYLAERLNSIDPSPGYWQSEYCILEKNDETGGGSGRDLGMNTALFVARIIHNDLTICNARSWQWWTALTQFDYKDGLVYLDAGTPDVPGEMGAGIESLKFDGTARSSKLLWSLGNYSRFIRPGMVRVQSALNTIPSSKCIDGELLVSAYTDPATESLVCVIVNLSRAEIPVGVPSINDREKIAAYVTSETTNLSYQPVKGKTVRIPARSVVTLCFPAI